MADRNLNAKINVTFSEATSRQSLDTGDAVPTLFGKIKRWLSDLKAVAFSGSYADLTGKPTSLPASDVYSWAKAANKPSYTAGEVGAAAASHNHTKSQITDFPASLKNPTALTVQLNGTNAATYDGSSAKTVNVTPEGIGVLPTTGGTLTGELEVPAVGKDGYIAYPEGGVYTTDTSAITGYLKITLPVSWTSTMISLKINIYDYSLTTGTFEYVVGGYTASDSMRWENARAYSNAYDNNPKSNLPVRFGHDGTKCAIYIGEADTVWRYPQIFMSDISVGAYSTAFETWSKNWNIDFTTTLGTITATVTDPYIGARYLPLEGNAASATKLATARTIALTGDVSGSASFDGSANASISTTVADATTSVAGLMTAADKTKLNGIAAGAQVNPSSLKNPYALTLNGQTYDGSTAKDFGSISNPNILVNSDFKIWQRGNSINVNGRYYTADRWRCDAYDGGVFTVEKVDTGLKITCTTAGGLILRQFLENPITETVKATICVDGVVSDTDFVDNNTFLAVWRSFTVGETEIINWAKLEIGSVATPFVPPNPATELVKCERYYQVVAKNTTLSVTQTISFYGKVLGFEMPLHTPMREEGRTLVVAGNINDLNGIFVATKDNGNCVDGCSVYGSGAPQGALSAYVQIELPDSVVLSDQYDLVAKAPIAISAEL